MRFYDLGFSNLDKVIPVFVKNNYDAFDTQYEMESGKVFDYVQLKYGG